MKNEKPITVYFGGEARELWTDDGLTVSYSGGVALLALTSPETGDFIAAAPEPSAGGDVKSGMADFARARELACRINDGSAAPLTLAYFRSAAFAAMNISSPRVPLPEGAVPLRIVVEGRCDALKCVETLRILLDEEGLGWDEAAAFVRGLFIYFADEPEAIYPQYPFTAPLAALAALQPRTARLVSAVNEKLCERLWEAYPGDWRRIGGAAIVADGEIRFDRLAAFMCGTIRCKRETLSGELRAYYTIMPEKFEETV